MLIATPCDQLAATGFSLTPPLTVLAIVFVLLGAAFLVAKKSGGTSALVLVGLVAFGSLTIVPGPLDSANAAVCDAGDSSHKHAGNDGESNGGDEGDGGDGGGDYVPPVDGDGICQWTANPTNPVLGYSGVPTYWIQFDYTSVLQGVQASDCSLQFWYYEDFAGDTDHDPNVPSSWTLNADIAWLIGVQPYNPSPGILIWTPGSSTNFIRLKVIDSATSEVVAIYDSNVFDAVPPQ